MSENTRFILYCIVAMVVCVLVQVWRRGVTMGTREGFLFEVLNTAAMQDPSSAVPDLPSGVDLNAYVPKSELPSICASFNANAPTVPVPSIPFLLRTTENAEASGVYTLNS
jgi:hypothetical protein